MSNLSRVGLIWALIFFVLTIVASFGRDIQGPYYFLENMDPSYQYLTSSLNILDFHAPRHTDHPGTTLQVFGAGVILVGWLFHGLWKGQALLSDVLLHPEFYLILINESLLLLLATSMTLTMRRMWDLTGQKIPVFLIGCLPFIFFQSLIHLWWVSPEVLLLVAAYLTFYVSLPLYFNKPSPSPYPMSDALGLCLGFGMATKVTFFPWILTIFLLPTKRLSLRAFGVCFLTFVVCTLPILSRYKFMLKWNMTVLKHTGQYGEGTVGLPMLAQWCDNLWQLWTVVPEFFVMLVAMIGFIIAGRRFQKASWIVLAAAIAQGLLALKHPGARYVIPALMWMGMWMALLSQESKCQKWLLVLLGVLLCLNISYLTNFYLGRQADHQASLAIEQHIKTLGGGCLEIRSYSLDVTRALQFGNSWNGGHFSEKLDLLYPHQIFYEFTHDAYSNFSRFLLLEDVKQMINQYPCTVFETFRIDESYPHMLLKSLPLESKQLKLYQVEP